MPTRSPLRWRLSGWRHEAPWILLLLIGSVLMYWKITLTTQFTWADNPDLVNQVLPWLQEQARQWQSGQIPVWSSHQWAGYPLVGQGQPGVLFPLNWILSLTPMRDGHLKLSWLNWYYTGIHFLIALSCYALCRDRGCSRPASLAGAIAFGLGGFAGNTAWPQMINGLVPGPLVLLFLFRAVEGTRPATDGALAGCALGIAYWSGHHQIPTFLGLASGLILISALAARVSTAAVLARVVFSFAALTLVTAAPQALASRDFYMRSLRWVGTKEAVAWGDRVMYSAHMQFDMAPAQLIGLIIPHLYGNVPVYAGIVLVLFAILACVAESARFTVRALAVIGIVFAIFSLGQHTPLHGIIYSLVPTFDKSRNVAFGISMVQLALAVAGAIGFDCVLKLRGSNPRLVRLAAACAGGFGLLLLLPVFARAAFAPDAVNEPGLREFTLGGLAALAVGILLHFFVTVRLTWQTTSWCLLALVFLDTGTVTGINFRHKEHGWSFLNKLSGEDDTAEFLRRNLGAQRFERNYDQVSFNMGEWHGLDEFSGHVSGLTSVLRAPGPHVRALLGVKYYVSGKPRVPDQPTVFTSRAGTHVYADANVFPRAWSVHEVRVARSEAELASLMERPVGELRRSAPVEAIGDSNAIQACGSDPDQVRITHMEPARTALQVRMACSGLLVVSNANFPEWHVTVDGRPAALHTAYGFMQSVVVPAGEHTVEFRYIPLRLYVTFAIAVLAITLTVGIATLARRRPAASATPGT